MNNISNSSTVLPILCEHGQFSATVEWKELSWTIQIAFNQLQNNQLVLKLRLMTHPETV